MRVGRLLQVGPNLVGMLGPNYGSKITWVRASLPERGVSTFGWTKLQLRGELPFDSTTMETALAPDYSASDVTLAVRPSTQTWSEIKATIREAVDRISSSDNDYLRLAIFPLAPISACIFLGYTLTNRINSLAFQYHRDFATWSWPKNPIELASPSLVLQSESTNPDAEVYFVFSLSATVDVSCLQRTNADKVTTFIIKTPTPSTSWLQERAQLRELGRLARDVFERAAEMHPNSLLWHIYFAGPAPGAVVIGQQLNPTMIPPVQLYEFAGQQHVPSIAIGKGDSRLTSWC